MYLQQLPMISLNSNFQNYYFAKRAHCTPLGHTVWRQMKDFHYLPSNLLKCILMFYVNAASFCKIVIFKITILRSGSLHCTPLEQAVWHQILDFRYLATFQSVKMHYSIVRIGSSFISQNSNFQKYYFAKWALCIHWNTLYGI